MTIDRDAYMKECDRRWSGPALRDARRNFVHWQPLHSDLLEAMRQFKRNPYQEDQTRKRHNPSGTLADFIWNLQAAWQPDKSRLDPLLDFEERFQKVFLRRGLLVYCTLLLQQMEVKLTTVDTTASLL